MAINIPPTTEVRQRIIPFRVDRPCTSCGQGQMRPTGVILQSIPPFYPHVCTVCHHREDYLQTYPYIDYVDETHG